MSRRELILAGLVVLLVGILIGLGLMWLLSDDDDADTETGAGTTTTSLVETTTTTEAPPTPESTTAPSTTESTTTTSTEPPPPPPPVADAVSGEILGLAIGTPAEEIIAAMTAIYGEPDFDSGWNAGCELDGGPDDHERRVNWGNLSIRFDRWDQPERLDGWRYMRGAAGFFDPEGPTPDDIVLHPGVEWGQTGAEVAAALGVEMNPVDIFGLTFIGEEGQEYRAEGLDGTTPFNYVGHRNFDVCE